MREADLRGDEAYGGKEGEREGGRKKGREAENDSQTE